jgi:hypothetical protein
VTKHTGPSAAALEAAAWVVNMENGAERTRLYNGHIARRRDIFQDSYRADDHAEADAWLIEEWKRARSLELADAAEDDDPCCEECWAWSTGESHAV